MTAGPFGFSRVAAGVLLLALQLTLAMPAARAASVPWLDQPVALSAREQPVAQFLEELFGQIGIPVRVSGDVRGYVNGDFAKSAAAVSDDILKSFQLSAYYDGAVVSIYPSNEVSRTILPVSSRVRGRIMQAARDLGLPDGQNVLSRASNGGLMVTGARRFVEQVEELADAVQRSLPAEKSPPATYRVFRLKYAWADDVSLSVGGQTIVVPGVARLLRSLIEPGGIGIPSKTRSQSAASRTGLRGQGLNAIGVSEIAPDLPELLAEPASAGGTAAQPQDARIVADSRLNALIVRDTANRMPMYESLIASLDVEPTMLEIEATIIDMDTDRLRELGVNWRLQDGDSGASLGRQSTRAGRPLPGVAPAADGQGGVVSLVVGDRPRFISRIHALEAQGAARIVSKPHVITLSDVEAILDTTSTFFVRVAGQQEVDLFDVSVGTTLRVTPHVFEANGGARIKLLVSIEDGSTSDRQVDSIPVIERSTINTQALIDGGESLLIGGLVREFTGNSVAKVPVLGDIPGLGALFRSRTRTTSRVERLFLITPHLTRRPGEVHRFEAPLIKGSEADILATAPARFAGVQAALDRRDSRYPVLNELPAGGASVSLTSAGDANAWQPAGRALPQAPAYTPPVPQRRLELAPASGERRPAATVVEWRSGDGATGSASASPDASWQAVATISAARPRRIPPPIEAPVAVDHIATVSSITAAAPATTAEPRWTPVSASTRTADSDGWQAVR